LLNAGGDSVRFKGTLILLIVALGLGAYLYFYEIKGGEQRDKAKQAENQIWKLDSSAVRQMDISSAGQHVTLVRSGEKDWSISEPRPLPADSDEADRLAGSASDIRRESVLEENATDLARFGLDPPQSSLKIKTKEGKEFEIHFGHSNPTGSLNYAMVRGRKELFLVNSSVAGAFDKKLDDLRNHSVLSYDKAEIQNLSIKSAKDDISLDKDNNDQWWLAGKERVAADSPGIRGILNALSLARIKEFYPDSADARAKPAIDHPLVDVSLIYGKNRSMKHLIIGPEKPGPADAKERKTSSEKLYLARDESRSDLFYVDKELVDKLLKSRDDLREKALAVFQRWDIDSITLSNQKGNFKLSKSNGEWFLGDAKKRAKYDLINALFDSLEKKTVELIENPAPLSKYGLDKPVVHIILMQGSNVVIDCFLGNPTAKGIYARVKGDPAVKIADPETWEKFNIAESDLIEPPPPPKTAPPAPKK
jgi:hypothetical protein